MRLNKAIKLFCLLFFLVISCTGISQKDSSIVSFYNSASIVTPKGYSHAALIDLGKSKMIILSGQVPLDSKGNLVGKDNLAKQAEQVFLNIQTILSELGGTMDNLVNLGIYIVDVNQIQIFREVRNRFINEKAPPTSTLVQVPRLFKDDVLLEVDATAIIPKK